MTDIAAMKMMAAATSALCAAGAGGCILADAITPQSNVSLEAACIVGGTAVVIAAMFVNLKRDVKEVRNDMQKIKAHIRHCKFNNAVPNVELEDVEKKG